MITPAYALTATERVLPRMALDFTTGVLDSRVTVTRALNTATAINSSGFIAIVNANLPRFDYDPVTLAPKGLLIEEARTNLLTYSEDFTDVSWLKDSLTITSNSTVSPDGTANADTVTPTTSNTPTHRIIKSAVTVAGSVTISVFVKPNGYSKFYVREGVATGAYAVFDIANGTIFTQSGGTGAIVLQKNGFYRASLTLTTTTTTRVDYGPLDNGYTSGNPAVYSFAGDGVSGVILWGAQLEAGAFATSYIPTTTLAVLRNADVVNMTGTNFSSWYNSSEGTFSATFQTIVTGSVPTSTFIAAFDNNASKRIMYIGSGSFDVSSFDGVSVLPAGIDATGSVVTCLSAYSASGRAIAATGLNPVTGTVAAGYSTATLLNIGNAGGVTLLNGWFSKLRFWPQRLTARELSAFSK